MKPIPLLLGLLLLASCASAQQSASQRRKGNLYAYWGWHRTAYTKSNISFSGNDYNFKLHSVVGDDRHYPFSFEKYFGPANLTAPQYNFRLGYYLNDHWDISFGLDHMKYIVRQYQTVDISGYIARGSWRYDGVYDNEPIWLKRLFLTMEHTDGLNYANIELRRSAQVKAKGSFALRYLTGVGTGVLVPKTNTTLLEGERYDEFHLSGFGVNGVAGLNLTFLEHFFVQGEVKSGFMNLSDIRTSQFASDRARQSFFYLQGNWVFGAMINFGKKASQFDE